MFFHFVKSGDSIYKLSKLYDIKIDQLIDDNNLTPPYKLVIGECLIINKKNKIYKVKNGDNLTSISQKNFIDIDRIIKDNNIDKNEPLLKGKNLILDYSNQENLSMLVNGFCYQSIESKVLNHEIPYLNIVSPFCYRFNEQGNLINLNDTRILDICKESEKTAMLVIANLKEKGGFSSDLASLVINNKEVQITFINNIKDMLNKKYYQNVCIDFEYVYQEDKNNYIELLKKIKEELSNYSFYVCLAPKYSDEQTSLLYYAHDYYQIGKISDYVIIMTYEWGYTYGEPMAVSPLNKVKEVLRYAKSKIDKNKILMGIPNYGYDWVLPYQKGNKANSLSNIEAINLAKKYNSEIKFDSISKTPYFNYKENNILHVVHFDDPCSINLKINLAIDEEIKGISIWTINTYYPQLYELLNYYFDQNNI